MAKRGSGFKNKGMRIEPKRQSQKNSGSLGVDPELAEERSVVILSIGFILISFFLMPARFNCQCRAIGAA
jgi:hypothetical protein